MTTTANFQVLRRAVIDASVSSRWDSAVNEWEVTAVEEHPSSDGECVCGQINLLWMFTITNRSNGAVLFPIGSSCVNHFERADLNQQVKTLRKLMQLRIAAQSGQAISLTSKFFSRALLEDLLDAGAFSGDEYNGDDGWNDFEFLRRMFGVRDKSTISRGQRWKLGKLMDEKIIPFVLSDERLS